MDLYTIKTMLNQGKNIYDLPLLVTYYARVSTDREEQLNSLENQVMFFEKFIKKQEKWQFIDGYIDEGISGTSVKKRQNFLQMIEDGKKGKFNLIITKEISRFSRNTLDSIKYTQELLSYGVGIYFFNDNINTFQSDSELRLTIMSSIAQDEIRKLSERVRFGYKRSIEKGIVAGSNNILGYIKDKGKLKINEPEAKIIKLIFETYVKENIGLAKLGIKLFEEYGIANNANKPYSSTVLSRQIKNPKYKGYYCANKETTIDYHNKKRKRLKKDEWIVYKDNINCPPIVSEELWEQANKKLQANACKHKCLNFNGYYSSLPFSGVMHCYHDGATFVRAAYRARKKDGIRRKYWACSINRKYGSKKEKGCHSAIIYYEELVSICRIIFSKIIDEKTGLLTEIKNMMSEIDKRKNNNLELEIKNLESKIEKAKIETNELIKMRIQKEITPEEYTEVKKQLTLEIEKSKNKLSRLKENKYLNKEDKKTNETFKKMIDEVIGYQDDRVLEIVQELFQEILVESIRNKDINFKVILHTKLNIFTSEEKIFTLENLLAAF